jgi:transcriptional regulator with XRE-family HTH domain
MDFATLHERLVANLRARVKNGELTERSLARLSGISQPHIHNVLKRARILSPELADLILSKMQLSILDLLDRKEITDYLARNTQSELRFRAVPVLDGFLGPGFLLPKQTPTCESQSIPYTQAVSLTQPVVARLAADEQMEGVVNANDLVLLDQSETARTFLQPHGYYVVNTPAGGLIRSLRRDMASLYLISEINKDQPGEWPVISLAGRDILELVLARVVWLNRRRRWEDLPQV